MTASATLRRRLGANESVLMPGVWDPWSALLAERAGFQSVFLSGFALAGTLLGEPDIGIIGQSEMADAARRVCAAVPNLEVAVDADTGYGGPDEVARTVELWEAAGAAALFLEDQVWPKRCGHMEGKEVVPVEDWLAKLKVVLDERDDLVVVARTDARAVNGLDDAIERGRMARDLGVDAVFVEAPQSIGELERIAVSLSGVTLVANMVEKGKTPLLSADQLAEMGFAVVLSPLSGLLAATHALAHAYSSLHVRGTMRESLDELTPFDDFTTLVGLEKHLAEDAGNR